MIIINTISSEYFSLNGINYAKIYQPLKQGIENVAILNVYDSRQQIRNSEKYDQYNIDGTVYATQALTIAALLPVIYSSASIAEGFVKGSGTAERISKFINSDTLGDSLLREAEGEADNVFIDEALTRVASLKLSQDKSVVVYFSPSNLKIYGIIFNTNPVVVGEIFDLGSSEGFNINLGRLDSDNFVIMEQGTAFHKYLACSVSVSDITAGTPKLVDGSTYLPTGITGMSSNTFITGKFSSGVGGTTIWVGTIAAGVITFGVEYEINASKAILTLEAMSETVFAASLESFVEGISTTVYVGTIAAGVISYSAGVEIGENPITLNSKMIEIKALTSAKFIMSYEKSTGTYFIVGEIIGGITVFGAPLLLTAITVKNQFSSYHYFSKLTETKVVFTYTLTSNESRAIVCDIAGNVVSVGAEYPFATSNFLPTSSGSDSNTFIVFYSDFTNSGYGSYLTATVVGNTIQFDDITSGYSVIVDANILPEIDLAFSIGSRLKRFKALNGQSMNVLNIVSEVVTVLDEIFSSNWNGSLEAPTKNAVFDALDGLGGFARTLSDEETPFASDGIKTTFWAEYDAELSDVIAQVGKIAPTGSALIFDMLVNGVSVFTTKPSVVIGAFFSINAVIDNAKKTVIKGDKIEYGFTQLDSGGTAVGAKMFALGNKI